MSIEAWTGILGVILVVLMPVIAWLVSTVLTTKEAAVLLAQRWTAAEARVASCEANAIAQALLAQRVLALEGRTGSVEAAALTVDRVRAVIEDALDRRDRAAEVHRPERERALTLEIGHAVRSELRKMGVLGRGRGQQDDAGETGDT